MLVTMDMFGNMGGGYEELDFSDFQLLTSSPYTFTKAYKKLIIVTMSGADRTQNILLNGSTSSNTYYSSHLSQSSIYISSIVFDDVKVGDVLSANTGTSWAITMYGFN